MTRKAGRERQLSCCAWSVSRIPSGGSSRIRMSFPVHGAEVMIAMALACMPDLLIADEPTTALDVTIQAQILDLMRNLHENMGTSIILITHDLVW